MDFDALLLSRLQFAFTISFHILFPAFTIGLASYLAVLEGLWLFTKREAFRTLFLFWVKVFAVSFGMGVVSGVVLSYELGTNWSEFIRQAGGVIGPLLGYEVLTAFFLEASFLGVMLFGWAKVGNRLHFLATLLVAIGTLTSAFWILAANSWMQTPQGFEVLADGRYQATDFMQVIFNPSFPPRLAHMVLAAYLTTALCVAAAAAVPRRENSDHAERPPGPAQAGWHDRHRRAAAAARRPLVGLGGAPAPALQAGGHRGLLGERPQPSAQPVRHPRPQGRDQPPAARRPRPGRHRGAGRPGRARVEELRAA